MPKKILVIEDEKDIQELLQLYLKRDGYDVHIAKDGETGLRKVSQERYDLVLLDLMLPQMDGLEICRNLRSRPQTSDIPIIMITAKAEESDRIQPPGSSSPDQGNLPPPGKTQTQRSQAGIWRDRPGSLQA